MALEELALYLQLTPEFGGTRFGPFEGLEVRLGSGRDRCHIVLPESFGVLAEHAKVIRQGPDNLILAPAERTATIFLWKAGARRPEQLSTPTAIRPGDGFSLVTPSGPRFEVVLDELPPEIKKQREESAKRVGVGRRRLSAKSMGEEGKRQIWTRLLVLGPAQLIQRAVIFVKSGAIFQPRNIFLGITILGGYIFGGAAMCSRSSSKKQLGTTTTRLESCETQLGVLANRGENVAEWDFAELAGQITGSVQIGASLEEDDALLSAVKAEARNLMADSKRYAWLIEKSGRGRARDFALWREEVVASEDFDNHTRNLVIWLAAPPGLSTGEFDEWEDSTGRMVCGRGPLRMSYRQGLHLGLSVLPDAYKPGVESASLDDVGYRDQLLGETLGSALQPVPEGSFQSTYAKADQGLCVYVEGEDDRQRINKILRRLAENLGSSANNAPDSALTHGATMRVAKYWAGDLPLMDFTKPDGTSVDFSDPSSPPSALLSQLDSGGEWALKQTARTIARSIVLPCRARLEGKEKEMQSIFGEDGLPQELPCLVLSWKLQNNR